VATNFAALFGFPRTPYDVSAEPAGVVKTIPGGDFEKSWLTVLFSGRDNRSVPLFGMPAGATAAPGWARRRWSEPQPGGIMDMKVSMLLLTGLFLVIAGAFAAPARAQSKRAPGLYATFQTNQGTIVCQLYEKEAPITVKNFVDLAEGNKEWKDPKTGAMKKSRYYDGIIFHRVIPDFMIQGGDPTGTGTGGPGYEFKNEYTASIKFDKAGRLAMANRGRDTNGSQFFITEAAVGLEAQDYTIFGQCSEGLDVVKKIARVPKAAGNRERPATPVVIEKLVIERVAADAP
jgi:peptidyl-prolyl cis-trans isomerase A (cyclophilin A)